MSPSWNPPNPQTELTPESAALWTRLVEGLAAEQGVTEQEWKCYSAKAGWTLRLKRGTRTIVYLMPREGGIGVAFVLGERAMQAARQLKLPRRVVDLLDAAPRYAEGTGVRLEVRSSADVAIVKRLAAVKAEN